MRQSTAWLEREIAVSRYLIQRGAQVTPPTRAIDAGPHLEDGLALSFWRYLPLLANEIDPVAAGQRLRHCHQVLALWQHDLPPWAVIGEAWRLLLRLVERNTYEPADARILTTTGKKLKNDLARLSVPLQAVHGDAHLGNVLQTGDGPLWNDWEDTFSGLIEWDLACLVANPRILGINRDRAEAALAGYGHAYDPDLLVLMIQARTFQLCAWFPLYSPERPLADSRFKKLLAWLNQSI